MLPIPSPARLFRPAVAVISLAALSASPAAAAGGDLVWTFQGIENVVCMDEIQDQNSDGVPDVIVETYDAGAVGDHLYCLSGGAPGPAAVTIWSIKPPGGPSSSGGYGDECVRTTPDISGDGIEDVLLGTAWGGRTAYGIDGTDGAVIWDFDTYVDRPPTPATSGWVYTVLSVPDVDDDAFPDVFFGCGSDNDRAYHVSGDDGNVMWSLDLGDAIFASDVLDDVSGDGKADAVIGVGDNAPAVWCFRGGPAALPTLWMNPMPGSVLAVARIGDLTGDLINDVLVGTWDSSVFAFNGVTGDTIWVSSLPGFAYVMQIAVLDDVNDDGLPDAAIGTWDDRTLVLSGADGSEVWTAPTGGDVWTVSRVADVNLDGINDVAAGSFDHNVYVYDGTDGTPIWSFNTGKRLYYVQGVSDLTNNGAPDVIAGTQYLSGSGGRAYLLEGGDDVATPADLPMYVVAESAAGAIEIELGNAGRFEHCVLERSWGEPNGAAAVSQFRRTVVAAHREGLLSVEQALHARAQDPQVKWTRVSEDVLSIAGGRVVAQDQSAEAGRTYTYRFAFVTGSLVTGYSPTVTVTRSASTSFAVPPLRVHPNPVGAGSVTLEFSISRRQAIRLDAYDAAGRRVAEVHRSEGASGDVRLEWNRRASDGAPLPNGVYFLRLEGSDFVSTEKVTILR